MGVRDHRPDPRVVLLGQLGAATVSLDGNVLAFSVDVKGDERYTMKFKDLRTGELYDDTIVGIGAGGTWAADSRTLFLPIETVVAAFS